MVEVESKGVLPPSSRTVAPTGLSWGDPSCSERAPSEVGAHACDRTFLPPQSPSVSYVRPALQHSKHLLRPSHHVCGMSMNVRSAIS